MEPDRLLGHLDRESLLIRAAAASAPLEAAVPGCPDWSAADLLIHVATVYLHKAAAMREGAWPDPWPPDLSAEDPHETLDRAFRELRAEFVKRRPTDHAPTWYEPDQSVGFWIRRMAHETVVHRIDAEQAAGMPVTPVPDDLAADGVDEVLRWFLEYEHSRWPEDFALVGELPEAVAISVGDRSWTVRPDVTVVDGRDEAVASDVSGSPDDVLKWLWGRAGGEVAVTGDAAGQLRRMIAVTT